QRRLHRPQRGVMPMWKRFLSSFGAQSGQRKARRTRLSCEHLEARCVPTTTINVTDTSDAGAGNTLRAAIMQANSGSDDYVINLSAATYALHLRGRAETGNFTGDLDIKAPNRSIQIVGVTPSTTVIDAAEIDRAFHVLAGNVTFSNVTIDNGLATDDGV